MGSGHYFQQTVNFDLKEEYWYYIIKEKRKHLSIILFILPELYYIVLLYIDQRINCIIVFILSLTAMETSCMGAQGLSPRYRDIEVDGRVIDRPKDPPGQKSIYILPGATEREVYRLTTFKMFPQDVPIDIMLLAKCGFHFTGYKDRVKCFSCGVCVESWMIGDDPTAAKWHFESCELVLGTDERNVPISSFNGAKNKLKFTHDIKRQTDFDSGIGSMTSSHSSQPNSPLNQDVKMPGGTSNGRITPDELMSTTQSVTQSFSNCHIGNGVSNVNIQIGLNNVMANGSSNGAVYQTAKYVPPVSGASG
uniref:Uncharacterized protein n=1 Tax=Ciona savignyi TaxID=51511 RepID=H2YMW1_CIOSA